MYRTNYDDEQFVALQTSLTNSSRTNKTLYNSYIMFLFIIIIAIYNISDENYLKNVNINLVFINMNISIDDFLFYIPFLIGLFHLLIMESLIIHHKKVLKFLELKTELTFENEKNIYIYPFIFNDKGFYSNEVKSENFTNFIAVLGLVALPNIVLIYLLKNSVNIYIIFILVGIMFIFNFIWAWRLKGKRKFSIFFIIIYVLLFSFYNLFLNNKFNNAKNNFTNKYISNDSTNDFTNQSFIKIVEKKYLNGFNTIFVFNKKFIYSEPLTTNIRNRDLYKFFFYKSDLINSKVISSKLEDFKFREVNLVDNIFFNTDMHNVEYYSTNWKNQVLKENYLSIDRGFYEKDNDKIHTLFSNIKFYDGNKIEKSLFEKLDFKDIKFYGKNIIKSSEFISNEYEDVEFRKVEFDNVVFSKGQIGMSDITYNKNLQSLPQKKYYEKSRHNFFNEISKANIFDEARLSNVTFRDITIENLIFDNTLFKKIKIEGSTIFKNVTFMYRGNIIPNEAFFRSLKKCNNCKYVDFINKKILINDNGKIYPSNEKLESYGIKK